MSPLNTTEITLTALQQFAIAERDSSAIDPALWAANTDTRDGDDAIERFLRPVGSDGFSGRTQIDAQARAIARSRQMQAVGRGGIFFYSYDLIGQREADYCRVKPIAPRGGWYRDEAGEWKQTGKRVKYEALSRISSEVYFAARIPGRIWQRIVERNGVAPPLPIDPERIYDGREFWPWVKSSGVPIVVTEGEKKALALLTHGAIGISLPGVDNGVRTTRGVKTKSNPYGIILDRHLHPSLRWAIGDRTEIAIAFDADSKAKTVRNVGRAIGTLAYQLEREGAEVSVMQWRSKLGKGIDDVLAAAPDALDKILSRRTPVAIWRQFSRDRIVGVPTIRTSGKHKYLADEIAEFSVAQRDKLHSAKLIFLRAPMGTGKTFVMEQFAEQIVYDGKGEGAFSELQREGTAIMIGHRIVLMTGVSRRLGLPFIDEKGPEASMMRRTVGLALCADSLIEGKVEKLEGHALAIVDEASQVLDHLMFGSTTIQERRPEVLGNIQRVFSTCGRGIIGDANLDASTVEFFMKVAGVDPADVVLIDHDYQEPRVAVTYGSQAHLAAAAVEAVMNGQKIYIATESAADGSLYAPYQLAEAIRREAPDAKILEVTGETVHDKTSPAYRFTERADSVCAAYDAVIVSPVAESGLSIDLKGHFDAIFGLFGAGTVATPDTIRQSLRRVREVLPTHLYVQGHSAAVKFGGSSSPWAVRQVVDRLVKFSGEIPAYVAELMNESAAQRIAKHNSACYILRDLTYSALAEDGYTLIAAAEIDNAADWCEILKIIRDDRKSAYCHAIASADELDEKTYRLLKEKGEHTRETLLQIQRYELSQRYPIGEVTPELVALHLDDAHECRNAWLLNADEETRAIALEEEIGKLRGRDEHLTGAFSFDIARRTTRVAVTRACDVLGVTSFIQNYDGRVLSNYDPEVIEIFTRAKQNERELKALGVRLPRPRTNRSGKATQATPVQVVKALCKRVGYDLSRANDPTQPAQITIGNCRQWLYTLKPLPPLWQRVHAAWDVAAQSFLTEKLNNENSVQARQKSLLTRLAALINGGRRLEFLQLVKLHTAAIAAIVPQAGEKLRRTLESCLAHVDRQRQS